jgi:hypothetical protein
MNPMLDFKQTVIKQRHQSRQGFKRNIVYKNVCYTLKAEFREYGFINWSVWSNNQQLAWTDNAREVEFLLNNIWK